MTFPAGLAFALITGCATTPPPPASADDPEFVALGPPSDEALSRGRPEQEKLGKPDVMRVALAEKAAFKACAGLQKRRDGRSGTVYLTWHVDFSGVPTDVAVETEEWRGSIIGECLLTRVRQWRFPRHRVASETFHFPVSF